jgi:hypothetical protein
LPNNRVSLAPLGLRQGFAGGVNTYPRCFY